VELLEAEGDEYTVSESATPWPPGATFAPEGYHASAANAAAAQRRLRPLLQLGGQWFAPGGPPAAAAAAAAAAAGGAPGGFAAGVADRPAAEAGRGRHQEAALEGGLALHGQPVRVKQGREGGEGGETGVCAGHSGSGPPQPALLRAREAQERLQQLVAERGLQEVLRALGLEGS
jgi:hypothetical protein